MKRTLPALLIVICFGYAVVAAGQVINDPSRIEVSVTPYYNSKGATINVGRFSKGLGASSEPEFVATIARMVQAQNAFQQLVGLYINRTRSWKPSSRT